MRAKRQGGDEGREETGSLLYRWPSDPVLLFNTGLELKDPQGMCICSVWKTTQRWGFHSFPWMQFNSSKNLKDRG